MQDYVIDFLKKGMLISPELTQKELDDPKKIKLEKHILNRAKINIPPIPIKNNSNVEIISEYIEDTSKKELKDFIKLYNQRYKTIQSMLLNRQELSGTTSIRKLYSMENNEQVSIIGIILEIKITKNNNIILTLEDKTGHIKAIVTKRNKETFELANQLTPDEIIGVHGAKGNGVMFVNSIICPDIPLTNELKKSPNNEAVAFIGDIHIGSQYFLEEIFDKFILWINGSFGSLEQKKLVKKIRYLFIVGDLVEGIGIFPGQEKELKIKDIFEQYDKFTQFIKKIPKHINIIICPGNHDAVRIAEPQPIIPKEYLVELYEQQNVFFVTSPSLVNISKTNDFPGFNILVYHGYSFPYYATNIGKLRLSGGLEKVETTMEYLLKKRHLAPTHGSTRYHIGYDNDPLIIKKIPDFFVTGHIHRASVRNYRNVTLINSSCWISQTEYQEKRGLNPEPGKVIYVNLNTRKPKIINLS